MKKFTIFFLMLFMYLGNQVRCESVSPSWNGDEGILAYESTPSGNQRTHLASNSSGMLACNFYGETGPTGPTGPNSPRTSSPRSKGVKGVKSIIATINGPHYACADGRVRLTATVDDNEPNDTVQYTYTWFQSGNVVFGPASASYYDFDVSALASDTAWFHVEVTKNYPTCITSRSAEFLFTKIVKDTTTLVASTGSCSTVLLTANFHARTPGATAIEYSWIKGGNVVAYTTEPTYVTSTGGDYRVAVTYQVGDAYCTDTSAVTMVTISGNDNSTLTVDNGVVCEGASVTLTATSGGTVYTWYDGATRLDPTDSLITLSALTAGEHYFRYVDNSGCTADTVVIVHSLNVALFSAAGSNTCAEANAFAPATFYVQVDGWAENATAFHYKWYVDGQVQVGEEEWLAAL